MRSRIVLFAGIAIAALLLVLASLPFLIDVNRFRPALESNLTQVFRREVKVGDLKLSLLSRSITAANLSIADDPSVSLASFITAESMKVGVDLWPLIFEHKLKVNGVTIDRPSIALMQSPKGIWNFSSLGVKQVSSALPPAPGNFGLDLPVNPVRITGGHLSLRDQAFEDVNIDAHDVSPASVFPISVTAKVAGGGEIKIDGKVGPISKVDAELTPFAVRLNMAKLNLAGSAFAAPASGMAGLVSFTGTASSDGQTLLLKAKLRGDRLRLAANGSPANRIVDCDFTITHDLKTRTGTVNPGEIHIGSAHASLTGDYNQSGDTLFLNMTLNGDSMDVTELAAMLPALGVALPAGSSLQSGSADANLLINGRMEHLVLRGSLGLINTRLAGFDLGSKLSTVAKLVAKLGGGEASPDTDIQSFSANVLMDLDGTSADHIKLVARSIGELSGFGSIDANHALFFRMSTTLNRSGDLPPAVSKGGATVRFLIQGTSSEPVFRPDLKGTATGMLGGLFGKKK